MDDALLWLAPSVLGTEREPAAITQPSAERSAGVYDGLLVEVAPEHHAARDQLLSPADRARSLAPLVPRRGVLVRFSAVWVHTGGRPPPRVSVAMPRGGGSARRQLLVHVQRLPDRDTLRLGGRRVTTAVRTACDLLRFSPSGIALPRVADLLRSGLTIEEIGSALGALGPVPGSVRAAGLLRGLAP